MSKYTPGPWSHQDDYSPFDIIGNIDGGYGDDGTQVRYTAICRVHEDGDELRAPSREVAHANVRLIAAAPDLLAACWAAKKFLESDLVEPGRTVFWKLVEAIRKAEGA